MSKKNRDKRERNAAQRATRRARPLAAVPGDGSVYETAVSLVAGFLRVGGRAEVAHQLEAASESDDDIARAYAGGMQPAFRPEAREGALTALREHGVVD